MNNNANASPLLSTSPRRRALVQMYEIVTASSAANCNWTSGTGSGSSSSASNNMNMNMNMNMNTNMNMIVSDLRPLLLLMDIGSCASAEKHCKVNCVTGKRTVVITVSVQYVCILLFVLLRRLLIYCVLVLVLLNSYHHITSING